MLTSKILALVAGTSLSAGLMADQILEINSQLPVTGTAKTVISGFSFKNKEVTYEKINGLAILEGDIVLGTQAQVEAWKIAENKSSDSNIAPRSVIISGERFRWIDNFIPFQFDINVSDQVREMVYDAIDHWESNTSMTFIERNNNNASEYPDFVNIVSDDYACWSFVGRRGGSQDLNVVAACGFGATVHEFGHAIGLWHEQSREDRDNFVQINWENIKDGRKHNFNQHINDGDDVGEYDYGSIMHYGAFAFTKNNLATITTLEPAFIGQRNGLSPLDIASINENYPEFMPVADIAESHYSAFLGNSISIDGGQSFDPNGDNLSYLWLLGDGNIDESSTSISYTYSERGEYTVTLTVTDNEGYQDTDSAYVFVYGVEVLVPIISSLLQ
jgi:astacin